VNRPVLQHSPHYGTPLPRRLEQNPTRRS
jgi:hypothetical protein